MDIKVKPEKLGVMEVDNSFETLGKGLVGKKNTNGFYVLFVHYSADPTKNTPEWIAERKRKYSSPETWEQEMELSFSVMEGAKFYEKFRRDVHIRSLQYMEHQPMWRGWDFGYRHPACVWFQIHQDIRVNVLYCLVGANQTINSFADEVVKFSNQLFPKASKWCDAGDIAARQKSDKAERTNVQILRGDYGIRLMTKKIGIKDRNNAVRRLLEVDSGGQPFLKVNAVGCTEMTDMFLGGLVRSLEDSIPKKDDSTPYGHINDALGYGIINSLDVKTLSANQPPKSVYLGQNRKRSKVTGY